MNKVAKYAAVVGASGLVAYGAISLGEEPEPKPAYLFDSTESWLQKRMDGAKAWIKRHPAITGTVAGCAAGSFVPIVGTAIGCATGATVGYTIGSDERAGRAEDKTNKGATK